jgi:hypothetical protein
MVFLAYGLLKPPRAPRRIAEKPRPSFSELRFAPPILAEADLEVFVYDNRREESDCAETAGDPSDAQFGCGALRGLRFTPSIQNDTCGVGVERGHLRVPFGVVNLRGREISVRSESIVETGCCEDTSTQNLQVSDW